ncbi:unnamed protein product [Paramecium sonneborni]|uniref:Uncharacterized protein n=1 Tax=Paramecium sonneborni TaxID=65129 RepID=A0A8S1N6W5_9CILI|nr:unnamed protein product [Paramecium sonneborni]
MKIKKLNREKTSTHSSRTIKIYNNKKLNASKRAQNKDLGKPPNLKNIILDKPNIWAAKEKSIRLITFLINQGRHFLLHPAGTKKILKYESNQQKQKEKENLHNYINKMKPLYDLLGQISITYLGFQQRQQKKERLIVFFFRNNSQIDPQYDNLEPLINNQLQYELEEIKFQLDKNFFRELHEILKQLVGNQINIQNQIKLITQKIVNQTNDLHELSQANTIAKNLFIQLLIEQGNKNLQLLKTIIEDQDAKQLVKLFKYFITSNSLRIEEFITNIIKLMQGDNFNNLTENSHQQDIFNDECLIQLKYLYPENDNSIYLSDQEGFI